MARGRPARPPPRGLPLPRGLSAALLAKCVKPASDEELGGVVAASRAERMSCSSSWANSTAVVEASVLELIISAVEMPGRLLFSR